MPGPTDDYLAYRRWFDAGYGAIVLPPDCTELEGPTFTYSNQYTWTLEWYLVFSNDPKSYVRIGEHFAKRAGLLLSRRISFAYHFGPTVRTATNGTPLRNPTDPVFVRIDDINQPVHLHPERDASEHLPQSRITGIVLDAVDLFDFVRASLTARETGTRIADELGYRII